MILGVDLGNTVCYKDAENKIHLFDWAIGILHMLRVKNIPIYIVSRVSVEQEIRSKKWLVDEFILQRIGIKWDHLYYCRERRDKSEIIRGLGITHFVDDQPEVMHHIDKQVVKILFRPLADDKFSFDDCYIAGNWIDVFARLARDIK